jgi:hypothetical protein
VPTVLDAPIFEISLAERAVDIAQTPYFFNNAGQPTYVARVPTGATLIPTAPTVPSQARGHIVTVPGAINVKDTPPYGIETQLDFTGVDIVYEPMWATRDNAAAFGITLVEPGQAVQINSPVPELQQVDYEYGVFAGHWSPYQNTGNKLLTVVCTDLEHHDFPHVFASTDPSFPLVTSVARYWPERQQIALADLWVPRGHALYIPPKPANLCAECIDLHNNRNSARACWGDIRADHITTQTLLQPNGYFYWFWNAKDTQHRQLSFGDQA